MDKRSKSGSGNPPVSSSAAPSASNRWPTRWLRPVALTLIAFVSIWFTLTSDFPERLIVWVQSAGAWGVVVFALTYIGATLLLLPASILTLGAGLMYGTLWGTLLVSPVSVIAATLAFLIARGRARKWVERQFAHRRNFAAVDQAIAEQGFKTVLLLRLSPVFPFSLLNYLLGLTKVETRQYVLASVVGMLPGTILYVYVGSLIRNVAELVRGTPEAGGPAKQALLFGGLIATFAVTWTITRSAKKALTRSLEPSPPQPPGGVS